MEMGVHPFAISIPFILQPSFISSYTIWHLQNYIVLLSRVQVARREDVYRGGAVSFEMTRTFTREPFKCYPTRGLARHVAAAERDQHAIATHARGVPVFHNHPIGGEPFIQSDCCGNLARRGRIRPATCPLRGPLPYDATNAMLQQCSAAA